LEEDFEKLRIFGDERDLEMLQKCDNTSKIMCTIPKKSLTPSQELEWNLDFSKIELDNYMPICANCLKKTNEYLRNFRAQHTEDYLRKLKSSQIPFAKGGKNSNNRTSQMIFETNQFNIHRYNVVDELNTPIPFYISPQPIENLQEVTELPKLEGASMFLYLVFTASYEGNEEVFYFQMYGRPLRFFCDMLKRVFRKLPNVAIGNDYIENKLIKIKTELLKIPFFKEQECFGKLLNIKHPFVRFSSISEIDHFVLFFIVDQFYDPHVNLSHPILNLLVCRFDKIVPEFKLIYDFKIFDSISFYIDLCHFDPRKRLTINDLNLPSIKNNNKKLINGEYNEKNGKK